MEILKSIFFVIFEMSLKASVVGIGTLVIKNILKSKISPKWLNILWVIFLVTLINPIKIQSEFSIYNLLNYNSLADEREIIIKEALDQHTNISYLDFKNQENNIISNTPNAFTKTIFDNLDAILSIIIIVYASMVVIKILISVLTNIKIQNQTRRKFENKRLENLLKTSKKNLNINKNILMINQNIISTPSVWGIIKTKILLKEDILTLSDNEIEMILLHELSHLKKGDILLNKLLQSLKIIYWFNPLIVFLLNKVKNDIELANDEAVIEKIDKNNINTYCKTLIKVSMMSNIQPKIALGIASKTGDLEERIKMIKAKDTFIKNKVLIIIAILLLCFGITVCLATSKTTDLEENNIIGEDISKYTINRGLKDITYPVEGDFVISATYSKRIHPITQETFVHTGIDITRENIHGDKVIAVASGIVEYTGYDSQYGNMIEIKHRDDSTGETLYTVYAHLSEIKVDIGQNIEKGQEIGCVGNTGMATGPHLHFEIRDKDKNHIDPNKYISF